MAFKVTKWDENNTNSVEPAAGLKTDGFEANDALPAATFNWLMRQNGVNWASVERDARAMQRLSVQWHRPGTPQSDSDAFAHTVWPVFGSGICFVAYLGDSPWGRFQREDIYIPNGGASGATHRTASADTLSGSFAADTSLETSASALCPDGRFFCLAIDAFNNNSSRRLITKADVTGSTTTVAAWQTSGAAILRCGLNKFLNTAYVQGLTSTKALFVYEPGDMSGTEINTTVLLPAATSLRLPVGSPSGTAFYDNTELHWLPDAGTDTTVSDLDLTLPSFSSFGGSGGGGVRLSYDEENEVWVAVARYVDTDTATRLVVQVTDKSTPDGDWSVVLNTTSGEVLDSGFNVLAHAGNLYAQRSRAGEVAELLVWRPGGSFQSLLRVRQPQGQATAMRDVSYQNESIVFRYRGGLAVLPHPEILNRTWL